MNTDKSIFQYTLYYGLALGITLSIFELIAYFLGILTKPIMSIVNISLVVSMLIIALRKYRDQINNGLLQFGQAFLIGFFICLISGFIWSVFKYVEYSLAPGIIEDILLMIEERLLDSSMEEDQIESLMKIYAMIYTAPIMAIATLIFNMGMGGAILSLIMAAIFKKEANPMLNDTH